MQGRGASALADVPFVFAEDHVIHVKTDELAIHRMHSTSFLSRYIYSISRFCSVVQRQTGRTFPTLLPIALVILTKLYEQIMYKM